MPKGIYKHKRLSKETKKKIGKWNKEKGKYRKHWKIKDTSNMNKDKIGKKRPPFSDKWKGRISNALQGNKNHLGKYHSIETKQRISEKTKGKPHFWNRGEKSPLWKGGRHREKHNADWRYCQWRMAIFERDNWTCQFCGMKSHIGLGISVYLEAHHIKSWAKYPEFRFDIDNGITLCKECHKLVSLVDKKSSLKIKKGGKRL